MVVEMKQIIYRMCVTVCLCMVVVGCDDKYEELGEELFPFEAESDVGHPLSFSGTAYFSGEGENGYYAVYAHKQFPWQFTGVPSWLTFSEMQGTGFVEGTCSAQRNPSVLTERSAYYYLESMLETFPIKLSLYAYQGTQSTYFSVSPNASYYSYGPDGGELVLYIKTNQGWHIREPNNQSDFVYFSTVEDSADCVLTVTIPPYDYLDGGSRSNTYYIYDNAVSTRLYEFQITQTPPESATGVIEKSMTFKKEGETQTLSLGTASKYSIGCDLAWVSVTPSSGTGEVELTISVLPNTTTDKRSGYAYVYVDGYVKAQIFIEQETYLFDLDRTSWTVNAAGGTQSWDLLSSDGSWKATPKVDWITVSPATGNAGNKQNVTFTFAANKSLDSRTGTVLFERTDGIVFQRTFSVTQFGRYFSSGDWKAGVTLGPDAQTASHEFNGDLAWTASTADSWITLIKSTGSPETGHTFSFSVTANTTQESRVGEITITYEGGVDKIAVIQESAYINTSATTIELPSMGGSHVVSISSNGEWTASVDVNWMGISYTVDGTEITLNASDNPTPDERVATITITSTATNTQKKLSIVQKGRYLEVPVKVVNFFLKGGEQRFDIQSDGKLVATSSDSWLTTSIESGNMLVLKASENSSSQARSATVTIYVSGLTSGELKQTITVNQLNTNVIEREEFGDDESIDLGTGGQPEIGKGEFGNDKNLNMNQTSGIIVNKTEFGTDKDLN